MSRRSLVTNSDAVLHIGGRRPGTSIPVGPPAYTPEWVAACYGQQVGDKPINLILGFPFTCEWEINPLTVPCVCGVRGTLDPVSGAITTIHDPLCKWLAWTEAEAHTANREGR